MIILIDNCYRKDYDFIVKNPSFIEIDHIHISEVLSDSNYAVDTDSPRAVKDVFKAIESAGGTPLEEHIKFSRGVKTSNDTRFVHSSYINEDCKKVYRGRNLKAYQLNWAGEYLWYRPDLMREKWVVFLIQKSSLM